MSQVVAIGALLFALVVSRRLAPELWDSLTSVLASIAILSVAWNAVRPANFPLSDGVLVLSVIPVGVRIVSGRLEARLPRLCFVGAGLVTLVIFLNMLLPVPQAYTVTRYLSPGLLVPTEATREFLNVFYGLKLDIGFIVMPFLVMAAAHNRQRLSTLVDLWAVSALVSCMVALTDNYHVTHINAILLGARENANGRQGGLTNHPNHLATVAVMTLPIVLTWLLRAGRWRAAGWFGLLVLCGGIYTTGSRGGLAAGLVTLGIAILAQRRIRQGLVPFVVPAALVVAAMFVLHPSLGHSLLSHTRVLSVNGQESDAERKAVAVQALHDIAHRPLIGVGFDVSDQGHSIYLQSIASGGILTLLGMIMYVVGTARTIRFRINGQFDALVSAATVSLMSWLVLGAIENDFADRYPYVPFAMLLAAWWLRTATAPGDPPTDVPAMPGELATDLSTSMKDTDAVHIAAGAGR